jgi:hypothetical protein
MKQLTVLAALAALAVIAVIVGCSNPSGGEPLGSPNAITGFTVAGAAGSVNAVAKTVTVTVSRGTALTDLAPAITIDGARIDPLSGTQQDFFTTAGYSPVVYTVTAADGSNAYWTVTVKWAPLEADADIGTYLNTAESGVSGGPVILPVSADLSGNGWADLLDAIDANSVSEVALDLSACTGGGAVFDPDYTISTGKDKIVSLILPDAATSIKAGIDQTKSTFQQFTALKSVTGGAVTGVGAYAFTHLGVQTVSFPAAAGIGHWAFYGSALTTVNLPAAAVIDYQAFTNCTALETVNLPAATTIGGMAFYHCTALETVSLPKVMTIEGSAFGATGTGALAITLGGTPPELGTYMFDSVTAAKTVTVKVPGTAAGYAASLPVTYNGSDTNDNWGNGFRGGGWNGTGMTDGSKVNSNISLTIEVQSAP